MQLLQETSRRFLFSLLPFFIPETAKLQSLFRRLYVAFRSRSRRILPDRLLIHRASIWHVWYLMEATGEEEASRQVGRQGDSIPHKEKKRTIINPFGISRGKGGDYGVGYTGQLGLPS